MNNAMAVLATYEHDRNTFLIVHGQTKKREKNRSNIKNNNFYRSAVVHIALSSSLYSARICVTTQVQWVSPPPPRGYRKKL